MVPPNAQDEFFGVYCFFRECEPSRPVCVRCAVRAPAAAGVRLVNVMSRALNGLGGSRHVVNERGEPAMIVGGAFCACRARARVATRRRSRAETARARRLHHRQHLEHRDESRRQLGRVL